MKRDEKKPVAPGASPFNNPFARLKDQLGELPLGPPAAPPVEEERPLGPARAVVRLERKGHGGKEVTVVEKLALPPGELLRWLGELKQALGCGGSVEGDALILQGDQRERLKVLLIWRGVRKISAG